MQKIRELRDQCGDGTDQDQLVHATGTRSVEEARSYLHQVVLSLLNVERYGAAGYLLWGDLFNPEPKSVRDIFRCLHEYPKNIILGCGAASKCMAPGTEVVMSDGSLRAVEEIRVGDEVMGPDSTPRRVLQTTTGHSPLYQIQPTMGDGFVCNEDHVLTLQCSVQRMNGHGPKGTKGGPSQKHIVGAWKDVPLREYLKWSPRMKECYTMPFRGWELPEKPVQVDPYIYGLWIGDGGVGHPVIHNVDQAIIKTWCDYWESSGYRISINPHKNGCHAYFVRTTDRKGNRPNLFKNFVRESYWGGEKRIRPEYLSNSRKNRLKLLAGIIDTDGCLARNAYSMQTIYEGLARDIERLATSLGLRVSVNKRKTCITSIGYVGSAWQIYISGECFRVPSLIKAASPVLSRSQTSLGFQVEPIGDGEYYGFSLDGDHRFILGSGLVTHNSYSVCAWLLMDWIRDPEYTEIKIISTTAGHADENVFSTLHGLHEAAIVPLPGIRQDGFIGLDPRNKHGAITLKSIPPGEDGKGALQGFHPTPRRTPHPIFGRSSRGRAFFDEGEKVPLGAWPGVDNFCASMQGRETIKGIWAANPSDVTSMLAQQAEPEEGWSRVVVDRDFEWDSRSGWHVLRIDGAETENVKTGRNIYPGFLTLEGYRNLQLKSGGNSPRYWTFARGMYPLSGTDQSLVPVSMLDEARGEFVFNHTVVDVAGEDVAFEGDDLVKLSLLRYGEAIGWRPMGAGEIETFPEPRWVVQLDQILDLPKLRTEAQYEQTKMFVQEAGVEPDWFGMDRTGNGTGVYDLMVSRWSAAVMGIHMGSAASDTKIMDESTEIASEICDGIHTEMHWALRQWIEFGYFGIGPHVDTRDLFAQLSTRKVKMMGKSKTGHQRMRLQSKKEFKAVYGRSPDDADAVAIGLHVARMNGWEKAAMSRVKRKKLLPRETLRKGDAVQFHNWVED